MDSGSTVGGDGSSKAYQAAVHAALGPDAATPAGSGFAAQICSDLGDDEKALLSASDLAAAAAHGGT